MVCDRLREKKGAMGKTLASFAQQADAEVFIKEFGGKLYRFDDITIDVTVKPLSIQ